MDKMLVDVKGAVRSPGVYEVVDEDRVIDVIKKAGGLKEGADELRINFAQKVSDQMVLYIPLLGEEGISMPVFTNDSGLESTEEKTININTANLEELQNLPGVGPSKAEAIISYREDTGLFKNPEDLKLVTGIGEKTFDKLKELIRVK